MSEPVFGVDAARTEQEIAKWAAGVSTRAQQLQAASQQVANVSVREVSREGIVTVTVDATGAVTDLLISDRIRELSGPEATALVLGTMRTAQSKITAEVAEVMTANVPDSPETVRAVVASYEQRFPEPPPTDFAAHDDDVQEMEFGDDHDDYRPPPPRRSPRPPRRDDDHDDDEGFGGPILD